MTVLWITILILPYALGDVDDEYPIGNLQSKLFIKLFNESLYDARFRPSKTTTISLAVSLTNIIELHEKRGYMTCTAIPKMSWIDQRLKWSGSEFENVHHLQVPTSAIWLPDLELFNSYRDRSHDSSLQPRVWINKDGHVYYVPRQTYQTPCDYNLKDFPFDVQTCYVILGSWAYLKDEVDFIKLGNGTDLNLYHDHTDFDLTNFTMDKVELYYEKDASPYVEMMLTLTLKRRFRFFYYMFLVPVDLFLFLLPVVHLIPPNKDSKLVLLGALLVSTVVMLSMLEDFLPGYYTRSAPKALRLYFSCLLSVLCSSLLSCISLCLSNAETKKARVPRLLQKLVIEKLGRLCCIQSGQLWDRDYQLVRLEKSVLERSELPEHESIVNEDSQSSSAGSAGSLPTHEAIQILVMEMQLARYQRLIKLEWIRLAQIFDRITAFGFLLSALIILGSYHLG